VPANDPDLRCFDLQLARQQGDDRLICPALLSGGGNLNFDRVAIPADNTIGSRGGDDFD
jgi:hypothetical protein